MTVTKCDRCGKEIPENDVFGLGFGAYREARVFRHDLCADCLESLKQWLKQEGTDENNSER